MRKKIVAGNWKMNMDLNEGVALATEINNQFNASSLEDKEVILCTPFIHLGTVSGLIDAPGVSVGAQNCNDHKSGAYTGEISAAMIRSTGAGNVIIGHSERRSLYSETDDLLAAKTAEALRNGLRVIFCCGEVLAERESGNHFEVVKRQLEKGLFMLPAEDFRNCIIAYEPVWAIGTGVNAKPADVIRAAKTIRSQLAHLYGKKAAEGVQVLYGGSVTADSAADYLALIDIDGLLVGGASLDEFAFSEIVKKAHRGKGVTK